MVGLGRKTHRAGCSGHHVAPRRRTGFSLTEALVSLTITAVAGAAIVFSVNSNLQLTDHTQRRVIAQGMARQLMDEVLGTRYMALDSTPYQTVFTPSSWELETGTRERFDDIDDYHGTLSEPPVDEYGILLGTGNGEGGQRNPAFWAPIGYLSRWQQQITVSYASSLDLNQSLSGNQTSDFRAVEVRIVYNDSERGPIELAKIRRIVSYVPSVP
ncbi:MAG: prepilin-type N-terminal cleavage/methylation domain-containing protein [Pirellulales bacterium]|nr:prepilin-type N-terminal cleavage/methylation domain-containing protein [Pirellulales bacterium]